MRLAPFKAAASKAEMWPKSLMLLSLQDLPSKTLSFLLGPWRGWSCIQPCFGSLLEQIDYMAAWLLLLLVADTVSRGVANKRRRRGRRRTKPSACKPSGPQPSTANLLHGLRNPRLLPNRTPELSVHKLVMCGLHSWKLYAQAVTVAPCLTAQVYATACRQGMSRV